MPMFNSAYDMTSGWGQGSPFPTPASYQGSWGQSAPASQGPVLPSPNMVANAAPGVMNTAANVQQIGSGVMPSPSAAAAAAPSAGFGPQQQSAPAASGIMPSFPQIAQAAPPPGANATGGPTPATMTPQRTGVYSQLYQMGRQMPGGGNMFAQFDPNAAPPPPPLQPPPNPLAPPVPPRLPVTNTPPGGIPTTPPMRPVGAIPQQPQGMHPADQFPRVSRLMGRPLLPDPRKGGSGAKQRAY